MNSESFDFNINNYSISDLENFLNLDNKYSDDDVITKINIFFDKITNISDIEFKNKLKYFIEEVKSILITPNKNKIIPQANYQITDFLIFFGIF
jgi:hypothetical protein